MRHLLGKAFINSGEYIDMLTVHQDFKIKAQTELVVHIFKNLLAFLSQRNDQILKWKSFSQY